MTTRKKTMNAVLMPAIGLAMLGGMAALPQVAVATDSSASAARKVKVYTGESPGPMGFGKAIGVDVNPTLKGAKSYKVVLKTQHKGNWVRCQAKQTQNVNKKKVGDFTLKGKKPHEFVAFAPWFKAEFPKAQRKACKAKEGKVYKVVVKAQHGYQGGSDTFVWDE